MRQRKGLPPLQAVPALAAATVAAVLLVTLLSRAAAPTTTGAGGGSISGGSIGRAALRRAAPPPPPAASVLVGGTGGLGNVLFQVAAAVLYAERHGYEVVLDSESPQVSWGTSNYTNRDQTRRMRGRPQSYLENVFASARLRAAPASRLRGAGGRRSAVVANDYTADVFSPPPGFNGTLEVSGYCQHRDLFLPVLGRLPSYLNLEEDELAAAVLRGRYGLERGQANSIMLGVRRGADFAHMTKLQAGSYERALREVMAAHAAPASWRLVVLADVDVADMELPRRAARVAAELGHALDYAVVVQEDDITQLHAGLCCDHFVLSESTFHYWIAVLRTALAMAGAGAGGGSAGGKPLAAPEVLVFNDTDLTNRPLAFDSWKRVQY